jgi:hypothetical protein
LIPKLFEGHIFSIVKPADFSNFKINKSKFQLDQLRQLIQNCGGTFQPALKFKVKNKNLVKIKCDPTFDRNKTDTNLAIQLSAGKSKIVQNKAAENEESEEDMPAIDYHWVTDSIYFFEL